MRSAARPGPGAERARPIAAVTTDFWYTLCFLPSAARRRVEARRRRAWSTPLRAAGLDGTTTRRHLRALERWNVAEERRGHAPSIARQARRLAAGSGVDVDAAAVTRGLESSLRGVPVRSAPGVHEALARLADRGTRLGLVSNLVNETSASVTGILEELGLDRYWSSRQFSSDLPWSKPLPGPFRRCLRELGVAPGAAVHVGDRALDRVGAHRAGMRAIVYTGLHSVEFGRTVPRADRPPARAIQAVTWKQVVQLLEPSLV